MIKEKLKNGQGIFAPITIFKRIEINLLTFPLIFFALLYRFSTTLLITYLIVLIHETAHLITAIRLKVKPEKIIVMPFGISLRINSYNIRNPIDEIKIAVSGPLSNFILIFITLILYYNNILSYNLAIYSLCANSAVALINIVPALPLDGGRILRAYLTTKLGYIKACNITVVVTKILATVLTVAGLILLYITKFNFSVLLITAFLIVNCTYEQRGSRIIMMREILYSRQKITDEGIVKTGVISILENTPAKKALNFLSYNKYYTINLINKDLLILSSMTETKYIEKLIDKGIKSTAKEIFDK